ncbi:hypothetical protein [Streptomyces sp. NPDC056132]|uniref:hypothetical protein n=1 Tax=Streptomyces sp. NPDC056132 TaxID=3345722 RepID=UPI0035DC5FE2
MRSNAQRRREARAAAHKQQAEAKAAAAQYANAAFWTSQAAIAAGLLTPELPAGAERQAAETPAARAERARIAADYKAAVANSKMGASARRELAEALGRFRDPRGAQEAAQDAARARQADCDCGAFYGARKCTLCAPPCPCGCGGTTRATGPDHTQHQPAAPQISPHGGTPGKAENNVAALAAETAGDLRERGEKNGAQPAPDTPDLGKKYEQGNNKLQQRMRLLDEARAISTLWSVKRCGVDTVGGAVAVTQKADGSGGFNGLFRCGSVWSCPECMPVVRADRSNLMEQYALAWGTEHDAELCTGDPADAGKVHTGHGSAMATLTSRHGKYAVLEDRLAFDSKGQLIKDADGNAQVRPGQMQRTANAWRRMLQSRWWRRMRAEYGIVGATRAIEVTHSWGSGWHTHIHAVVWFEEPVTDAVAAAIEAELYKRWDAECRHQGLGRPTRKHGVKVEAARRGSKGAAALARYLVKVQDKDEEKAVDAEKAKRDPMVNRVSRDARPTADQARRLKDARARRDRAREQGRPRDEAEADSLIADIREEIGQAARARSLGNELLRGDMKTGRKSGRTAMELLRLALAGDEAERELYREYERATKGSRMLTWAGDVRERLERLTGAAEQDPQQVVAEDEAKHTVAVLVQVAPAPWKETVAAHTGRRGQVRVAVKVASDHAIETGLDMEAHARAAVRELLESWGLVWGTDMHGPDVDMSTGEVTGEHVVPTQRTRHRRPQWEDPDQLEANAAALGVSPRDYARPQQARRRAAGLPIARTRTDCPTTTTTRPSKPRCIVCDLPVAEHFADPIHPTCDPSAAC